MPMPPHMKRVRLKKIALLLESEVFVETGTYRGDTTNLVSRVVNDVKTIEIDSRLAAIAQKRFAGKNVRVYQGNSAKVIPEVAKEIKGARSLFWLDGHYSAGVTGGQSAPIPILQELEVVLPTLVSRSAVLIDDVREFGKNGYPHVSELQNFVTLKRSDLSCRVLDDMLLIAEVDTAQKVVSTFGAKARAMTI